MLKDKLEKLIDAFICSSETMQKIVEKKIAELEKQIKVIEFEISKNKELNFDKEKHIRDINSKISKLRLELENSEGKRLTRKEWLDKVDGIFIESKDNFRVEYNLD